MSKECTASVNGIFVILVFFSHYAQYAAFEGIYDAPYLTLRTHLDQMVVASFLFYSGYGMMESIRKKGDAYVNKIPAKFWKLLLRFDTAVFLFLIMNSCFGTKFPVRQVLLSLIAWDNVGNSNWYIFVVLCLYVLMFLSFRLGGMAAKEYQYQICAIIFLIVSACFVYALMKAGRPDYYYNTLIILPMGVLYSLNRERVDRIIMRNDLLYFLILLIIIGVYYVSFLHRRDYGIEGYTIWVISFTALLIAVTMKVRIGNRLLEWLGAHVFSIYILQRIPMTILYQTGCINSHKYISLIAAMIITAMLALLFERSTDLMISAIERAAGQRPQAC